MLNLNNKLIKLIKIAIKLVSKVIYTLGKIEKVHAEIEAKKEFLETSRLDLTDIIATLTNIQTKLENKNK